MRRTALPQRVARTLLVSIAFIPVVLGGGRASADAPAAFGWWTTENPGAPQPQIPGQSGGIPGDPSPDIPAGGFEVTDVGADVSYAAIGYYTYGSTASSVILKLAPNAEDLPNSAVEACLLTGSGSFNADQAGPVSEAPPYSCVRPIQGVEDTNKRTVTFQVSALVHDGYLGMAIVVAGQGRLVFAAPDSSTVKAQPPPVADVTSPAPVGGESTPPAAAAAPSISPPAAPVSGPIESQASPSPVGGVGATTPVPASTPAPQGASSPSPSPTLVAVSTSNPRLGTGDAAVGAVLIVIAAIGVLVRSRRTIGAASDYRGASAIGQSTGDVPAMDN